MLVPIWQVRNLVQGRALAFRRSLRDSLSKHATCRVWIAEGEAKTVFDTRVLCALLAWRLKHCWVISV